MVISLNFFELMNLLSCFQVPTKYEKKLNIWFVHLQVIFDQSPTSEKRELENLFCRWILEIWTWNLRGYISHVVAKKSLSIAPGGEMKNEEAELSFVTPKAERSHREVKRQKEAAIRLKGKGNAWWSWSLEKC